MPAITHHEVLDAPESLRLPLVGSIALHLAIVGAAALAAWRSGATVNPFGDPDSSGPGSVTISPVARIPMYHRSDRVNPVANDTESLVPRTMTSERREREVDPEAIAIGKKDVKAKPKKTLDLAAYRRRREAEMERPNQVYSRSGAAASTQLFGASGGGGVGLGNNSPFGTRFGYYEQLIREKVSRNWKLDEVPLSIRTAPPVVILFDIQRDGSVRNVQLAQSSGIGALDYSCQRAVLDAAPFEPLPQGFERTSAHIEFWFQLKR